MIRHAFYLTALATLVAITAISSMVPAARAFNGAAGTPEPSAPRDDELQIPGFPPMHMAPGFRAFGPDGPLSPELRGEMRRDQDPAQRSGNRRQRPADTGKKPTEAEKAEALRKALSPKPSTASIRQQTLNQLFEKLAASEDDETALGLSGMIERIWAHSDSETANLLMERGTASLMAGHYPLALALFDKLIALNPQWAEAWNKRATTRFKADDLEGAMADINQVLKLEPRHYGALAGMGLILQRSKLDKQALDVFRKALALNPHQPELRKLIDDLSLKVEGRDI